MTKEEGVGPGKKEKNKTLIIGLGEPKWSKVGRGVEVSHNCSWNLRKILKLRDIARRFLRYDVGTEEHIHLWLDWWHPMGVLFEKFGFRVVYDAHSTLEAKLSSVIQNGNWF